MGETDETLEVTEYMVGKKIKVTATAKNGNKFESEATAAVKADKSAEITLVDKNGLQSDGTALPTDLLSVSYGQDLGTPSTVIWWCDGVVKAVYTTEGGGLLDAFTSTAIQDLDKVAPTKELDEGDWWVTIENTEGVTSTTNVITVAESHIAIMEEITITDDYDTAANVSLTKLTQKSVVTVKLNKEYTGTFYLAPEKTTKFNSTDLKHQIDVSTAVPATSLSKFTDKAAIAQYTTNKKAISYLDKKTGEITYKFQIEMANAAPNDIKRGSEYYLIFDQDDYEYDDIATATATGDSDDLNMSELVEVPYIEAPASIEIPSYSKTAGTTTTKINLLNEEGEKLAWWTTTDSNDGKIVGLDDISMYNITSNTPGASDTARTPANATGTFVKDGVLTVKYTGAADTYAYAKITTTAGVFGEESETLTSAVRESNGNPADSFKLSEDSSDPKAAKIEFENLKSKGSGTVYLFQSNSGVANGTTATDIAGQDKEGPWMVASKHVEGGTTKVTLENVFSKGLIKAANNEDYFAALFVPDDEDSYASMTTTAFQLTQQLKSYKLKSPIEKTTAASVNGTVVGVDQFGQEIDLNTWNSSNGSDALTITTDAKALDNSTTAKATDDTVAVSITAKGALTLAVADGTTTGDNGFTKGTAHSFDIAGGQKVTVTCVDEGSNSRATAKFTITLT